MKAIQLTRGKVAIVDDEDFEELNRYKWHCSKTGYAIRTDHRGGKRKDIRMHRQILSEPDGFLIDHINGDKLDNRRVNLRLCTNAENMRNGGKRSDNKSGYRGVCLNRVTGKWEAGLRYNGKNHYLGLFTNKHDAARMYNFWAADLFGEFARLNKITEDEGER